MTSIASTELRNAGLAGSTLTVARRALLPTCARRS